MVLNTSCYPNPSTTKLPVLNEDSVKSNPEDISIDTDIPSTSASVTEEVLGSEGSIGETAKDITSNDVKGSLDEEVPLWLEFEELVDDLAEGPKSAFLKEMFLLDYQEIKYAYSDDPRMRLEISFFREALVKIMETEFYLTLILGRRTFKRIYSEIPSHYKVNGHNFYEGVKQYHDRLQQSLDQSSLEIKQVMTIILLDTAIKLSLIEQREENIKQSILDAENPDQHLLEKMQQVMRDKSQIFANQSWAMILFEEVGDHRGNTLLLKDLIMKIYKDHLSLGDIDPEDDLISFSEKAQEFLDHIHTEIQPSLHQVSQRVLEMISGRVDLYRSKRTTLFVHDLIQQETLKYLEEAQDNDVLTAYNEFINQRSRPVTVGGVAIAAGRLLICNMSRVVSVSSAILIAAAGILDSVSLKQTFYRGVIFGLNNYLQYDLYDNADFSEFVINASLSAVAMAFMCSKSRSLPVTSLFMSNPVYTRSLSTVINSFSKMDISLQQLREGGRQLLKKLKEGVLDINALPSAIASLATFYFIGRLEECDEILTLECHKRWDEEFVLLLSITFVVEFVFVFKSLNSGKVWFSDQHFQAMQDIARTVFGISLGTQAALNLINGKDFFDINYRLAFFEVIFGSLISLSTTKFVLLKMVDPFSGWLQRRGSYFGKPSSTFFLMLLKNIFGNYLYLQIGHGLLDDEQITKDQDNSYQK